MNLTRRSFLKALAAGAITIAVPSLVIAKAPDIEIIILRATATPYDPFVQIAHVGWKATGSDGKQYGDIAELSDDVFDSDESVKAISPQIADLVSWSMKQVPQLKHLALPTSNDIEKQLLRY